MILAKLKLKIQLMNDISFLDFQRNIPLSNHSTFRIGGTCDYFIEVREILQLMKVINFCKTEGLKFHILGKGSNSLFSDRGFRGVVIFNKIDFIEKNNASYRVGAGYSFSLLGAQSAKNGFKGLEFASGIPASVGGAIYMNAGANGGETKDYLYSVEYLNEDMTLSLLKKSDIEFSYRYSSFQKMKGIILAATFELMPCKEARDYQLKLLNYRTQTQPYSDPSAGCVFKNPGKVFDGVCLSAGSLIESAGLKGCNIGGAQVSSKHANFIINKGSATAQDVKALIEVVKQKVYLEHKIWLEDEVRFIDER
jgi:UDP-N-acetylmuramate dehydrogenase